MKSSLVKSRLHRAGWSVAQLAEVTGIPADQICRVVSGERTTARIQEAIAAAVRSGSSYRGIPGRLDLPGWRLFGALWWARERIAS